MNYNNKVNLFIIGAPKCGTTSLANYLNEHPDIKLGKLKEPHYFNSDMKNRYVESVESYEKLFKFDNHSYYLDASVWYYYSEKAIRNIFSYNPEAKFIYMVREPVSMFYSLHQELLNTYEENHNSPEVAWNLSESRKTGKNVPYFTKEKSLLYYSETCALGKRLEIFKPLMPLNNLLIIDFKNFIENTSTVYNDILSFLDLKRISLDFVKFNSRKTPKSLSLAKAIKIMGTIKSKAGIKKGFNILNKAKEGNLEEKNQNQYNEELNKQIKNYFTEDVKKLSFLSGQNFNKSWKY